jgi:hypothetical protein
MLVKRAKRSRDTEALLASLRSKRTKVEEQWLKQRPESPGDAQYSCNNRRTTTHAAGVHAAEASPPAAMIAAVPTPYRPVRVGDLVEVLYNHDTPGPYIDPEWYVGKIQKSKTQRGKGGKLFTLYFESDDSYDSIALMKKTYSKTWRYHKEHGRQATPTQQVQTHACLSTTAEAPSEPTSVCQPTNLYSSIYDYNENTPPAFHYRVVKVFRL